MKKEVVIRIIFLILLALLVTLILIFQSKDSSILNETCPGPNCIKVQTTCCPCNMGGEEICVPKSKSKEYEINLSNCSPTQICPAVYNCKIETCKE